LSAHRQDQGFALLIVLFVLVLLGFLINQFLGAARTELAITGNLRNAAMAGAAADGGIMLAVARIEDGGPINGQINGQINGERIGGIAVSVMARSIAGRINPNSAPAFLLAALLRGAGAAPAQAQSLADAIVAWRSPAASPAALAALDARYRDAGFRDGPNGESFASRAALARVMGMTPALLAAIIPDLSLFAPPLPAAAAATSAVRAALRLVGKIDLPGGAVEGPRILQIQAIAEGPGRARAARCAIVRLSPANTGTPYRILRWRARACLQ
jgi:general secretion pathway protein K